MPLRRDSIPAQDHLDALVSRIRELERAISKLQQPGRSSLQVIDRELQVEPLEGEVAIHHPGTHIPAGDTSALVYFHDGQWYEVSGGAAGLVILQVKIIPDDVVVVVADNQFYIALTSEIAGMQLVEAQAWVSTPSTSGNLNIQIHHIEFDIDMIQSPGIVIEANEKHSKDATFQPTISTVTLQHGHQLRVDVGAAGTTARGLGVDFYFA